MKKKLTLIFFFLYCMVCSGQSQSVRRTETTKKIALTFDACMTRGMLKKAEAGTEKAFYDEAIAEYLHRQNVPATIFISGLWAEKYPEIVKKISADRLFEIGNHSYSHRAFAEDCFSLPVIPENEKIADIQKSQEVLYRLTGKRPVLFRFPGGCYNPADQEMLKKMGLRMVGWTFPSGDAFNNNKEAIIENVLRKARPGAIIVFHLMGGRYAPVTGEVLQTIIPELRKRGYEFVTVSSL